MRKARFVLYDIRGDLHIIVDHKTPLKELEKLEHCLGVYTSLEAAEAAGLRILHRTIERAKDNKKSLAYDVFKIRKLDEKKS